MQGIPFEHADIIAIEIQYAGAETLEYKTSAETKKRLRQQQTNKQEPPLRFASLVVEQIQNVRLNHGFFVIYPG